MSVGCPKKVMNMFKYVVAIVLLVQVPLSHSFGTTSNTRSIWSKQSLSYISPKVSSISLDAFGKQSYWESSYEEALISSDEEPSSTSSFSWYSSWDDLSPFILDLQMKHLVSNDTPNPYTLNILLPGIGNDPILVDMAKEGYQNLSAFDYAPSAISCCQRLLARSLHNLPQIHNIQLDVADARNLKEFYPSNKFDFALDKGTLDSIYLIGGADKAKGRGYVQDSIRELYRVMKPGGVVMSVTAVVPDIIDEVFEEEIDGDSNCWRKILDTRDEVVFSSEGYASINVDATMIAFVRL